MSLPHEGVLAPNGGALRPDQHRLGLNLALNYVEVEHFRLTGWAWPTGCPVVKKVARWWQLVNI